MEGRIKMECRSRTYCTTSLELATWLWALCGLSVGRRHCHWHWWRRILACTQAPPALTMTRTDRNPAEYSQSL